MFLGTALSTTNNNQNKITQGGSKATKTKHQSAIMSIQRIKSDTFSTSGADGQLNIWKLADMKSE